RCGGLAVTPAVDKLVRQASRPTLARLLEGARAQFPRRGAATTHPSSWLKQQIPIRTFADWDDARPGFYQVDLVAHCGSSTKGFSLHTLCAVDVATSWIELQALWGQGHYRVAAGVQAVRTRLPVALAGLDTDNGSEFINRVLYYYYWREGITFTRGRAWKKNDSALVEQKNGAIVRHLVGYDRFTSKAAYAQLAQVYALARLHVNFFQPVEKLVRKQRAGARVHRVFDRAQTPYQRLCAAGVLSAAKRAELDAFYHRLNPLQLQRDLELAFQMVRVDPQPVLGPVASRLRVAALARPCLVGEPADERERVGAHGLDDGERGLERPAVVVEGPRPVVLVVALDEGILLGEQQA